MNVIVMLVTTISRVDNKRIIVREKTWGGRELGQIAIDVWLGGVCVDECTGGWINNVVLAAAECTQDTHNGRVYVCIRGGVRYMSGISIQHLYRLNGTGLRAAVLGGGPGVVFTVTWCRWCRLCMASLCWRLVRACWHHGSDTRVHCVPPKTHGCLQLLEILEISWDFIDVRAKFLQLAM